MTISVHSIPDLLNTVPQMLGFKPDQDLVAIVLLDHVVKTVARADIPTNIAQVQEAGEVLHRLWDRFPQSSGLLLAYTDAEPWKVLARVAGIIDHQVSSVHIAGRHWALGGPDGQSGTWVPRSNSIDFRGRRVLGSRAEFAQLLAAEDTPQELEDRWVAAERVLASFNQSQWPSLFQQIMEDPQRDSPSSYTKVAVMMHDPLVWDKAFELLSSDSAERMDHVLTQAVRHSPETPVQAPILGMLSVVAWVDGNGSKQNVCLQKAERILGDEPGVPTLVDIGNTLADYVVPPSLWPAIKHDVFSNVEPSAYQPPVEPMKLPPRLASPGSDSPPIAV
jgi:hypothetical protein